MQYRTLGRTGLSISELALGGLYTSSLGGGVEETGKLLTHALAAGINLVDTAPAYADSEATLGQVRPGIESPLLLSTKLGGRPQPFDPRNAQALLASVEHSLKLLGRDVIDILLIHEPDRPQQYSWWSQLDPLAGPVLEVLDQLKRQGKIRFTGLAGTTVNEMAYLIRHGNFDVLLTAFNFNILFREAVPELLPLAAAKGMGVMVGSALGQGGLGRRFDAEVRRRPIWLAPARQAQLLALYAYVDELDIGLPELCLRFVLSEPRITTVLTGAKTASQFDECVRAVEQGPLSLEVLQRLDAIAAMVPSRPFEEPMILPLGKDYTGPGLANLGAAVPVGKLPAQPSDS